MASLLICMFLIILISSSIYYYSSVELLQKEYIRSNSDLLYEVNQSVERYFQQLDEVTQSLYSDNTFIDNLRQHKDDYVSYDYLEQTVKNILYSDDSIQYIYFYLPDNQTLFSFSRQNASHSRFPKIEQEQWYQKTLSDEHYFYMEPLHRFQNYNNFGSTKSEYVFSVNRTLRYYETGEILGVLSISYDTSYLEKICQNLTTQNGYLAVLDQDLAPIFISWPKQRLPENIRENLQKEHSSGGHFSYTLNGEKRILLWNVLDGSYILKDISFQELTKNTIAPLHITLAFSSAIFLFSILVAFYLSRTTASRLRRLTKDISEFGKENLTINTTDYGGDEIGTLASAFNEMTRRINELINLEYKTQLLRKNAELQALQAQVNPHYLNNVLQAMGTLGLKKGAMEVYSMANALAKNMRYALKSTTQMVPLKQEIEHMNDYLYIQNILWDNRLSVELEIEKGLENRLVPVFILQPLVENSFKHGFDDRHEGHIKIAIRLREDALSILVRDDGRGIPPVSLKLLQEWFNEKDILIATDEHIGIRNIYNRIRLIYGDKGSFTIDSPSSGGTVIHIVLPKGGESNV